MRLVAQIDQVEVILLVDTGSIHNFIDFKLAKWLKLSLEPTDKLRVFTASGGNLFTQSLCRSIIWEAQRGLQLVSGDQLFKSLSLMIIGPCTMVLSACAQVALSLLQTTSSPDIYSFLLEFDVIFHSLDGLPPHRLHDHRIPLQDESKVARVKSYRYLVIQKTKIENLIQEILHTSVIRDINSLFVSPIIMVKKKYGS
ncbi:reverse transcriptase [Gossypium australe]|uniref:Reverse transcriptase n=1 Tax=Gossypium australe TaxID=47621 RepID=A0A5B6WNV5_9ROSI|nr:reverse transcriptase [Gossypium australe]